MAKLDFSWDYKADAEHPKTHFRLYENQKMVVDNIAQPSFSLLMDGKADGKYVYSVTTFDEIQNRESAQSNSLTINFQVPAAPTGFKGSWA